MEVVTKIVNVTATEMNELIVQNEATVINSIYVDKYFQPSHSLPYALTTVSTGIATAVNKNVGTATVTNIITKAISEAQKTSLPTNGTESSTASNSRTTNISPSPSMPLSSLANTSKESSSNGTILGLAIGLPLAIFVLCLAVLFGLFVYRRMQTKNDPDRESQDYNIRNDGIISTFYRHSKDENEKDATLKEKKEPEYDSGVNSRITYKISKPYISHPTLVQTPEKPAFPKNPYRKNEEHQFGMNNYSTSTMELGHFPRPLASPFKKWNYESPLSKWFLTKSTMVQDKILTVKTPTMQLKQLNILSRANKSKTTVNETEIPYTESSPMLPDAPPLPYNSIHHTTSSNGSTKMNKSLIKEQMTNGTSNIKAQVLDTSTKPTYPTLLKLDTVPRSKPLPKPPTPGFVMQDVAKLVGKKTTSHDEMKQHDLKSARRSTIQEQGKTFQVIKDYQAVLMDEIDIRRGELLRVLARHTDGWCLVERISTSNTESLDGPSYLNENRGIVPGLCLKELM